MNPLLYFKQSDKILHLLMGIVLAIAIVPICIWAAPITIYFAPLSIAILAAFTKESYDQISYGGFNWIDAVFTVLGGLYVQSIIWII